jgi:DNA-directed RNA polymerase subunit A'
MKRYVSKKIQNITFGLMIPKFIKEMANAKIVTPELYDKEGYPVDGGLMDIRLGVIDPGLKCKTCNGRLRECNGHFGYIELARPVVHVKYNAMILDFLRYTCRDCGRILIPQEHIPDFLDELKEFEGESLINRRKRLMKAILKYKTISKCPHCNATQKKVAIDKPTSYIEDDKKLSPIEIRSRLEKVPDEDVEIFGLNPEIARPEWGIVTIFPVPPVTTRPSITLESGERSEDDLTHKLGDVVRINQRLFENINAGAPEIIVGDLWDLLQYHITTYFDNGVSQLPPARHRGGQPLKTLCARIKSKEGRIRNNLAGKRVNFSARAVISPDSKISINEVGIPRAIAKKLTVPERVTEWNLEFLKEYIKQGPDAYPGANYVVLPDGRKKIITNETKEQLLEEIQPGYLVERQLMDGDIALFNRQPSLHKMNMMCHKVRVLDGKTLRLNPCVCNPYNADFDGDEMNLHIPQTEESRAEAEILMLVQTQMISPRYGLSVIEAHQDSITGNYILTQPDFKMSKTDAIDMLYSVGVTDYSKLPNKKEVTGRDIISCFLPNDLTFKAGNKKFKPGMEKTDAYVIIEKGVLKQGIIDGKLIGNGSGLLLRELHKNYGADIGADMLMKFFNIGINTLFRYGLTVRLSDFDVKKDVKKQIDKTINKSYKEVDKLIEKFQDGTLESIPGKTLRESLEQRILEKLNKARNETADIVVENGEKNSDTMRMINSGGRGKPLNLAQIGACVGQLALRGGRVNKGYSGRTLSCFKREDLSPEPRGFIRNGFLKGLKPHELFFMSMVGRDSLMDTALRTPKSGYLYRRMSSAFEDLKVEYDYTVRDSKGRIVQMLYGEDGVDVTKSEGGKINIQKIINKVLDK